MATEKWVSGSGQGLTWGSAATASTFDGLASGSAILSDVAISNGTPLDIFTDITIALGSATFAAPFFVGVYLYPLDANGAYGEGVFASASTRTPSNQYAVGSIGIAASTTAQSGTLSRIVMPPGTFKFLLQNQTGVTWAAGGSNTLQYRTYNRAVV